jgi:hemolysin activation/secretion protein
VPGTNPALYQPITPSNFSKLTFSANRNQQLVEDGTTTLYTSLSGQFASTNLNSAEQFYLGGPYAVRAYPVAQSGGSQGGLFSVELRHQLQPKLMGSVFFDAGVVQQYKNLYPGWQGQTNANNTYSLMGAGFGMKWEYEGWNIGATVAWMLGKNPLYNQYGQAVNTDGTTTQPRGWITGSYNF